MKLQHCEKHEVYWLRAYYRHCPLCYCDLRASHWFQCQFPHHWNKELDADLKRRLAQKANELEPFTVKHYAGEPDPSIKGNGFDGLSIGKTRADAESFIEWINEMMCEDTP